MYQLSVYPRLLKDNLERAVSQAIKADENLSNYNPMNALTGTETLGEIKALQKKSGTLISHGKEN